MRAQRLPLVVKADGLAAGKGVVICDTHESAIATARAMLGGSFGAAGNTIVIEEFLQGEEVSFIVVASDQQVIALATSQDHKRRDDGDKGPNTGGMGAYSPAPIVTPQLHQRIMREVIEPTLQRPAQRRQSLPGLSLCRVDDRGGRHAQCLGIQLSIRRSGNAADLDAPAKRSGRSMRGRACRHAARSTRFDGTRARRSGWSWPRAATRMLSARAIRSAVWRRQPPARESISWRHPPCRRADRHGGRSRTLRRRVWETA